MKAPKQFRSPMRNKRCLQKLLVNNFPYFDFNLEQEASHCFHPITFGEGNYFLVKFLNFAPSVPLKT